jgi:competence protein ComEA
MKYGIKALMAAGVLVFAVGVQGALAAPASGKAAVNKENVQASASAKAEAVPGDRQRGDKVSINASAEQLAQALNGVGLKKPRPLSATAKSTGRSKPLMI